MSKKIIVQVTGDREIKVSNNAVIVKVEPPRGSQ